MFERLPVVPGVMPKAHMICCCVGPPECADVQRLHGRRQHDAGPLNRGVPARLRQSIGVAVDPLEIVVGRHVMRRCIATHARDYVRTSRRLRIGGPATLHFANDVHDAKRVLADPCFVAVTELDLESIGGRPAA